MGAPSMKKRRTDPAASGESALDAAKRSWRSDEGEKNKQNGTGDEVGIVNSEDEDEEMKTEENDQNPDEPEDSEVSSLSADDEDGSDDDDDFPSSEEEDSASTTQRGPQQPAGGGLKGLATAFQRIFAKAGESEARGSGGKRAVSSPDGAGEKKDDENVTGPLTTEDVDGGKKAGDSETKKSKKKSKAPRPLAEFEKKAEEAAIQENQKTRLARQLKATESLQARGIQTKPDMFKEQTFERELRSLATRGVVKLFTSMHQLQKQEGVLVSATGKSKKAERALEYAKERQQKREERADQMIYRHD